MIYSVLYGHLNGVFVKVGDKITYGNKIGLIGNTGEVIPKPTTDNPTAGTHLHISVIEGRQAYTWTLASMTSTNKPNKQQCLYFIENDLFDNKDKVLITAGWLNYTNHYAYDLVPQNKQHYHFYWNRSFTGTVTAVGHNNGYGNFVVITYDTSEKKQEVPSLPNNQDLLNCKEEVKVLTDQVNNLKSSNQKLINDNSLTNEQLNIATQLNKQLESDKKLLLEKIDNAENLIKGLINENNKLKEAINNQENDNQELNGFKLPKFIFECPTKGTYYIKLMKGYKLYISK